MKIVVVDGYTLNHGDLSWAGLAEFGDLILYEQRLMNTTIENLKAFLAGKPVNVVSGIS